MINQSQLSGYILSSNGTPVRSLSFVPSSDNSYIGVYAQYGNNPDWVPLNIGLSSVPTLQQVRDMNRNISMNEGSYEDAHFYLRSAAGNNVTTAFYTNADGGAIQAGDTDSYSALNLQPLGGLLTYGGNEVATTDKALVRRNIVVTDFNAIITSGIYTISSGLTSITNYPHIGNNNNGATSGILFVYNTDSSATQFFYPDYESGNLHRGGGHWYRKTNTDAWEYKNGVLEIKTSDPTKVVAANDLMIAGDYMVVGNLTSITAAGYPLQSSDLPLMLTVKKKFHGVSFGYSVIQEAISMQESSGNLTRKWIRSRYNWNGGSVWDSWNEIGLLRDVYTKAQLSTTGATGAVHWNNISNVPSFLTSVPTLQQVTTAGNSVTNSIVLTGGTNGSSLKIDAVNSTYNICTSSANGYARGLLIYDAAGTTKLGGIGFYSGVPNTLTYGWAGTDYNNSILKWFNNGVGIGLTGTPTGVASIFSSAALFPGLIPILDIQTGASGVAPYREGVVIRHSNNDASTGVRETGLIIKLSYETSAGESAKGGAITMSSSATYANGPDMNFYIANNATPAMKIYNNGTVGINNLVGTGSRIVIASSTGILSGTSTLGVANGGTGATTLTGMVIGNGTSAMSTVSGTANQLLRRNATNTGYEFFTPNYLTDNSVFVQNQNASAQSANAWINGSLKTGTGSGNQNVTLNSTYAIDIELTTTSSMLFRGKRYGGGTGAALFGYVDSGGGGIANTDPYTGGALIYLAGTFTSATINSQINGTNRFIVTNNGVKLGTGTDRYQMSDGSYLTGSDSGWEFYKSTNAALSIKTGAHVISDSYADNAPANGLFVKGQSLLQGSILLNKSLDTSGGISFYSSSYKAWQIYMAQAGTTTNGYGKNITAPTGSLATSWALRSFIENTTGYGWTWEAGTSTANPSSVLMELSSNTGQLKLKNLEGAGTRMIVANASGVLSAQAIPGSSDQWNDNLGYHYLGANSPSYGAGSGIDTQGGYASRDIEVAYDGFNIPDDVEFLYRSDDSGTSYEINMPYPGNYPHRVLTIRNAGTDIDSNLILSNYPPVSYIGSSTTIGKLYNQGLHKSDTNWIRIKSVYSNYVGDWIWLVMEMGSVIQTT